MRLSNGEIVYTDPTKWDTDGDGLSDGEGIYLHSYQILSGRFNDDGTYTEILTFGYQFFMKSDPQSKMDPLPEKDKRYLSNEEYVNAQVRKKRTIAKTDLLW